ncbi:MAG: hypothetical protein ACOCQR_02570 [bacterium]
MKNKLKVFIVIALIIVSMVGCEPSNDLTDNQNNITTIEGYVYKAINYSDHEVPDNNWIYLSQNDYFKDITLGVDVPNNSNFGPATEATITIDGITTKTNKDGYFAINNVSKGNNELSIIYDKETFTNNPDGDQEGDTYTATREYKGGDINTSVNIIDNGIIKVGRNYPLDINEKNAWKTFANNLNANNKTNSSLVPPLNLRKIPSLEENEKIGILGNNFRKIAQEASLFQ